MDNFLIRNVKLKKKERRRKRFYSKTNVNYIRKSKNCCCRIRVNTGVYVKFKRFESSFLYSSGNSSSFSTNNRTIESRTIVRTATFDVNSSVQSLPEITTTVHIFVNSLMQLSMLSRWGEGAMPALGGGFDSNRPIRHNKILAWLRGSLKFN